MRILRINLGGFEDIEDIFYSILEAVEDIFYSILEAVEDKFLFNEHQFSKSEEGQIEWEHDREHVTYYNQPNFSFVRLAAQWDFNDQTKTIPSTRKTPQLSTLHAYNTSQLVKSNICQIWQVNAISTTRRKQAKTQLDHLNYRRYMHITHHSQRNYSFVRYGSSMRFQRPDETKPKHN